MVAEKNVAPGSQALLYDVDRVADRKKPQILASASRAYDEIRTKGSYSYVAKSPAQTHNVSRVLLPRKPKSVKVDGRDVTDLSAWDAASRTYLVEFENSPEGVKVNFEF